jgi:anti-sigma regulatory factor (Ser/Thr protein kinase)
MAGELRVRTGRPGGHGIRLMRRYADAVSYSRLDDTNRLTLIIGRR